MRHFPNWKDVSKAYKKHVYSTRFDSNKNLYQLEDKGYGSQITTEVTSSDEDVQAFVDNIKKRKRTKKERDFHVELLGHFLIELVRKQKVNFQAHPSKPCWFLVEDICKDIPERFPYLLSVISPELLPGFIKSVVKMYRPKDMMNPLFQIKNAQKSGRPKKTEAQIKAGLLVLMSPENEIMLQASEFIYTAELISPENISKANKAVITDLGLKFDYFPAPRLTRETLQNQLYGYYKKAKMDNGTFEYYQDLAYSIIDGLNRTFPEVQAVLFGSLITGLATQTSDIDIKVSINRPDLDHTLIKKYFNTFIIVLKKLSIRIDRVINHARTRIPLIKGQDWRSKVFIDISIGKPGTLVKTNMLTRYAKLHPIIHKLLILIKQWASAREINSPDNKSLNSFCHSLLMLTYLMSVGVIPNLQALCPNHSTFESSFTQGMVTFKSRDYPSECSVCSEPLLKTDISDELYFFDWPITLKISSTENNINLLSLLKGYFDFMYRFDFLNYVVVPHLGGYVRRSLIGEELANFKDTQGSFNPFTKISDLKLLHVIDPFQSDLNVAASGHPWVIDALKYEYHRAHHLLNTGQPISVLFKKFHQPPLYNYITYGIYSNCPLDPNLVDDD